jgi:hypothetical protein
MNPSEQPPSLWQRLVGLFVLFQLLFLLATNVFFLLYHSMPQEPEQRTAATEAARSLPALTNPYAQLTGQLQGWSLFAPNVPRHAAFVFVEMRWPDRVSYRSSEQIAEGAFLRPPGTGRLLQYQLHLRLLALNWSQKEVRDDPQLVKRLGEEELRGRHQAMQAFMRWHLEQRRRQVPDEVAPDELVLWAQVIPLDSGASEYLSPGHDGPGEAFAAEKYPLARWRPGVTPPPACLPIELFDLSGWLENPESIHFNWVPEKGGT